FPLPIWKLSRVADRTGARSFFQNLQWIRRVRGRGRACGLFLPLLQGRIPLGERGGIRSDELVRGGIRERVPDALIGRFGRIVAWQERFHSPSLTWKDGNREEKPSHRGDARPSGRLLTAGHHHL